MNDHRELIEQVHASGIRLVLAITGGGSRAIPTLLEVPGGSTSILEAIVPYSAAALEHWFGGKLDSYCSERTARAMAMAAFEHARSLALGDPRSVRGIGATSSLVSTRPKRGAHRIHVAWQSADTTAVASCELAKGERTREEEESIATRLILATVAEACDVNPSSLINPSIEASLLRRKQQAPPEWTDLLLGNRTSLITPSQPAGLSRRNNPANSHAILFPGAFNPIHEGHARMADIAAQRFGRPVTFELSITNVDKPPLDFIEIADRLKQLTGRQVLLTRAATFVEKARIAPGCVFVVGADTLDRIADPRYYEGKTNRRDGAIAELADRGCRFLVFGRARDDQFLTGAALALPPALGALCENISELQFRADVSSTELRTN